MVDVKISALPAASSVGDADLVEIVQGGANKQATAAMVRNASGQTSRRTWIDAGAAAGPLIELFRDSASPAASDLIGGFSLIGRDSAGAEAIYAQWLGVIVDPVDTTEDGRMLGRVMLAGTLTDAVVVDSAGIDAKMGGLRVAGTDVVGSNRHLKLRSYAISGLAAATASAGDIAWCSDLGGGAGPIIYNGTVWTRLEARGLVTVNSDADFSLEALTNAPGIRHTGTLTANRVITLGTGQAYAGARFRVTRTGAGAFTLDVGGLKSLATNTCCDVEHDGTGWRLTAYGAL